MNTTSINNNKNQGYILPSDLLSFAHNAPFGLIILDDLKTEFINKAIFDFVGKKNTKNTSTIQPLEFVHPEDRKRILKIIDSITQHQAVERMYQLTIRGVNFNEINRFFDLYISHYQIEKSIRIQIIVIDISDELEKEKLLNQLAFESLMSKQKSDALIEIRKELDYMINAKKIEKCDFDKIFKMLSPYDNEELEWGIFVNHFESLFPTFITNLQLLYPSLSSNDIKHCACIRLNFSTKETAKFFNVSPSSIQTSRVRLKKKLNIDEKIDLREFIINI